MDAGGDRQFVPFGGPGHKLGGQAQDSQLVVVAEDSPLAEIPASQASAASEATTLEPEQAPEHDAHDDGLRLQLLQHRKDRLFRCVDVAASWQVLLQDHTGIRTQVDDYCVNLLEAATSSAIDEEEVEKLEKVFAAWKIQVEQATNRTGTPIAGDPQTTEEPEKQKADDKQKHLKRKPSNTLSDEDSYESIEEDAETEATKEALVDDFLGLEADGLAEDRPLKASKHDHDDSDDVRPLKAAKAATPKAVAPMAAKPKAKAKKAAAKAKKAATAKAAPPKAKPCRRRRVQKKSRLTE